MITFCNAERHFLPVVFWYVLARLVISLEMSLVFIRWIIPVSSIHLNYRKNICKPHHRNVYVVINLSRSRPSLFLKTGRRFSYLRTEKVLTSMFILSSMLSFPTTLFKESRSHDNKHIICSLIWLGISLPQAIRIGICKQRRSRWDGSSWSVSSGSTLFDILSFNIT